MWRGPAPLMAAGLVRDLRDVEPGLEAWLRDRHPDRTGLRIDSVRHASAGLSNETVLLRAAWDDGRPPTVESLALRLPARQATFPDTDLDVQALVQTTVAAAGLPTPVPVTVEHDDRWLGVPFLVMPFVTGRVGAQAPAFDPWLRARPAAEQRRMVEAFLDLLAALHGAASAQAPLAGTLRGAGRTAGDEVAWWCEYVRWAGDGDEPPPIVAELLAWCGSTSPTGTPPASLLWGDPRLGNVLFDPSARIVAALDWDMAFLGPAEHDVGWYLGLDEVGARVAGGPVPGFPSRDEARDRYEARLGRRLVDLPWYEVFALVRSVAVSWRQWRLAAAAGVSYPVPSPDENPVVPYTRELMARIG